MKLKAVRGSFYRNLVRVFQLEIYLIFQEVASYVFNLTSAQIGVLELESMRWPLWHPFRILPDRNLLNFLRRNLFSFIS